MRKVAFVILMLGTLSAYAQKYGQDRIDSLKAVLSGARDEQRLKLYIELMRSYNDFNRKEGFTYVQPALQLANKLKAEKKDESAVAQVKNMMGRLYWREQKYEQALQYHTEAKAIFERLHDRQGVALSIRYIGQDYADGGHYPDALKQFFLAKDMYEKLNDRRNMAHCTDLIAWVYDRQGSYKVASQHSYATLRIFEDLGDQSSIALAAAAVAEYAIHLGSYAEALGLFERSGAIYRKRGDLINQGYNHMLIGKVHRLLGHTREALLYYDSAMALGEQTNDRGIIATAYHGRGDVDRMAKIYDRALANYRAAATIYQAASKETDLVYVYCMMGECYRHMKNYKQATLVFDQALTLSRKLNNSSLMAAYYQGIEKLDSTQGNWHAAYQHHKEHIAYRDSVFNRDYIRSVVQLQMQYDFDKKEEAISKGQHEKDIRLGWQFLLLGIIAVLVGVIALLLYQSRMRIAGINELLKQKSARLEEENHEKVNILKVVSHDLRAPFGKIKGLVGLLKDPTATPTEKEQYFSYIYTTIDQGIDLIRQLLEAHSVNSATSCQPVAVEQFMNDFVQTMQGQLKRKQHLLKVNIAPEVSSLTTDTLLLTRILDNLVSNASKFSEPNKTIWLRVWKEDTITYFAVRDEGPGISEADQKKLFHKFQKLSNRPTAGEDSTGLGLAITKALVEQLNGNIQVNSSPGEGTEVIIGFR